jgi:DNA (cytosine-5)-methyltransferase 1
VKKYKPGSVLKAWFMENVTNSKKHLLKRYSFEDLGLKEWALSIGIHPKSMAMDLESNQLIINSADYGAPQTRRRIYTWELLNTKDQLLPPKTHGSQNEDGNLPPHITFGYVINHLPQPNSRESEELITDPLYQNIQIKMNELTDHFYDTGLYKCEWRGSKFLKTNHPYMGNMYFPEKMNRPSRTITATKIGYSREAIIIKSEYKRKGDGEFRTLTIREAASLMGFPINFQFLGSEGIKWKLVGNAVCPPVSRALAGVVKNAYKLPSVSNQCLLLNKIESIEEDLNLNTFKKKNFDNPPRRNEKSRFRRHPFKKGNLTVSLSNYDIKTNEKNIGKWQTSIQYGTGAGFPTQRFPDGFFRTLEPIIKNFERGDEFINFINHDFSKKISESQLLQKMYVSQNGLNEFLDPVELIELLGRIINDYELTDQDFHQDGSQIFIKNRIPKKQIMALYAINLICTIANGEGK